MAAVMVIGGTVFGTARIVDPQPPSRIRVEPIVRPTLRRF